MKTTSFNLTLVILGVCLVAVGLWRTFPPKINTAFLWNTIPATLTCLLAIGLCIGIGGQKYFSAGLDASMATTSNFLIMLAVLMPTIGFSSPLAHHFETAIGDLLKGNFGFI